MIDQFGHSAICLLLSQLLGLVNICFAYAPTCASVGGRSPPFVHFVVIGFFFIVMVQILSTVADQKESPIMVSSDESHMYYVHCTL